MTSMGEMLKDLFRSCDMSGNSYPARECLDTGLK